MLGLAIPLYDEEAVVERVVGELSSALVGLPHHLALVDNGSRDRTREQLQRLCLEDPRRSLIPLDRNRGYGGGILAGLRFLLARPEVEVLGWSWGDGQVDPAVIPRLYARCLAGADLAKARRIRREDGRQRALVSLGLRALLLPLRPGTTDLHGCPKLLRRGALQLLNLRSEDWFLDGECVLRARQLGLCVEEEDVVMRPRPGGRSKVRPATAAQIGLHLLRWALSGGAPPVRPCSG
jgi:dolichol-phosphate mannosyltransferase